MTVISAVITKSYTAHATDSLLTELKIDGTRRITEYNQPKLVQVKHWRGAMSYWGLARYGKAWSTLDWLRGQAAHAANHNSAEEFAKVVASNLDKELEKLAIAKPADRGIGIHFTAYEIVKGYSIPELFLISNWKGIPYVDLRAEGVGASRETYHTLKNVPSAPEHRDADYRIQVHQYLHVNKGMFRYNNGDPELFNPVADAVLDTFFRLMQRRAVKSMTDRVHCDIARRPIEVISRLLGDFSKTKTRLIGGKPHDLCISPAGIYSSTTGDC